MKGLDAGGGQGIGHVANTELDHLLLWIRCLEGGNAFGDVGKQVGSLQLEIMLVNCQHGIRPFKC